MTSIKPDKIVKNNKEYTFNTNTFGKDKLTVHIKEDNKQEYFVGTFYCKKLSNTQKIQIIDWYERQIKPKSKLELDEDAWHISYKYYGDDSDSCLYLEFRNVSNPDPKVNLYYKGNQLATEKLEIDWAICDEYNIERLAEKWWEKYIGSSKQENE